VVAALVIGGVFLLGMVAATGYAARTLPAGARVPLNAGVPERSVWLSKPAGLAAWLGAGVAAFAVLVALTLNSLSANWADSMRVALLPSVMLVLLAAQAAAVIVARRCATGLAGAAAEATTAAPEDAAPEDLEPEDAPPLEESGIGPETVVPD
jgi:hypothetical protein